MTETTNIWSELARGFRLIADECDCNAGGDIVRIDNPGAASRCFSGLLDVLAPGPATEERLLAQLGEALAAVMSGRYEDAEQQIAEACTGVQALRAMAEREAD